MIINKVECLVIDYWYEDCLMIWYWSRPKVIDRIPYSGKLGDDGPSSPPINSTQICRRVFLWAVRITPQALICPPKTDFPNSEWSSCRFPVTTTWPKLDFRSGQPASATWPHRYPSLVTDPPRIATCALRVWGYEPHFSPTGQILGFRILGY